MQIGAPTFLQSLGLRTVGIDISAEMVARARDRDPAGDYRVIADGDRATLSGERFDVVLAAFTFDNVPGFAHKRALFAGLRGLLAPGGILVNVVSTPEIYTHEWVTFTTRAFPGNRDALPGEVVRIVTTDCSDARPVDDVLWPHDCYRLVYQEAGLQVVTCETPLARGDEGITWASERTVAPWAIWVLTARP